MADGSTLLTIVATSGVTATLISTVGKSAATALSDLITGFGEIPQVWASGAAESIRASQARRRNYLDALNEKATELALADPERVERAMARLIKDQDRRQNNRESIAQKAFEDLSQNPSTSNEKVAEDFLNRFGKIAEDVSNEDIQQLFARILAGECRTPGTYSLAALNFFSMMDKPLAETIESFAGMISGSPTAYSLLGGPPFNKGRKLIDLRMLEGFGLVSCGFNTEFTLRENGSVLKFYKGTVVAIEMLQEGGFKTDLSYLTPLGEQVFGLVRRPPTEEELRDIGISIKSRRNVGTVTWQRTVDVDGRVLGIGEKHVL